MDFAILRGSPGRQRADCISHGGKIGGNRCLGYLVEARIKTLRAGQGGHLGGTARLRRSPLVFFPFVQQVGDNHQVVCEDGRADKQFEPGTSLVEAPFHATAAKEH